MQWSSSTHCLSLHGGRGVEEGGIERVAVKISIIWGEHYIYICILTLLLMRNRLFNWSKAFCTSACVEELAPKGRNHIQCRLGEKFA